MAFITADIKHILSITLKERHDDLSDQYNRLFLIKIFIISSLIIGFDYFNDEVSCIMPEDTQLTTKFVSSTCWIQGFFVYKDINEHDEAAGYYGIPENLKFDGIHTDKKQLCETRTSKGCNPMKKRFYLQYQYMTFYTAALTVLFYFPYIVFRLVNSDIIWLRKYLSGSNVQPKFIIDNFLDKDERKRQKLKWRIVGNIVVKILYVMANVVSFMFTDFLFENEYRHYGVRWIKWANKKLNEQPELEKPGNGLLPSMGICAIFEASLDSSTSFVNRSLLVCELSSHVLYQYCFLVLWFFMVIGFVVSLLGVIFLLASYVMTYLVYGPIARQQNLDLSLRELQYLDWVKRKNDELFQKLLVDLNDDDKSKKVKEFTCNGGGIYETVVM